MSKNNKLLIVEWVKNNETATSLSQGFYSHWNHPPNGRIASSVFAVFPFLFSCFLFVFSCKNRFFRHLYFSIIAAELLRFYTRTLLTPLMEIQIILPFHFIQFHLFLQHVAHSWGTVWYRYMVDLVLCHPNFDEFFTNKKGLWMVLSN